MNKGLSDIFELLTKKGCPFCFYALPNIENVSIVAQFGQETELKAFESDNGQSGFIFQGFGPSEQIHQITPDFIGSTFDFPWEKFESLSNTSVSALQSVNEKSIISKDKYLTNVAQLIESIKKGVAEKVVYSRLKSIPHKKSVVQLFSYLVDEHPNAFRYLLRTSNGQIWFGASPEILLASNANEKYDSKTLSLQTVALAGTVSNKDKKALFSFKNENEQDIVSRYIARKITEMGGENVIISEPFSSQASNVSHIKTNIAFDYHDEGLSGFMKLTSALHPTPAVGGTPLLEALDLISHFETADRGLYAGYLGPYNLLNETGFYVNIRCAQYYENEVIVHIGGGIIKSSDPIKEWEETELKAKLIENAIEKA